MTFCYARHNRGAARFRQPLCIPAQFGAHLAFRRWPMLSTHTQRPVPLVWLGIIRSGLPPTSPPSHARLLVRDGPHMEGIFAVHDSRFEQVDDRFFARVLQFLQAADADSNGSLSDRKFRRSEHLRGSNIQSLIRMLSLVCL